MVKMVLLSYAKSFNSCINPVVYFNLKLSKKINLALFALFECLLMGLQPFFIIISMREPTSDNRIGRL